MQENTKNGILEAGGSSVFYKSAQRHLLSKIKASMIISITIPCCEKFSKFLLKNTGSGRIPLLGTFDCPWKGRNMGCSPQGSVLAVYQ